MRPFASVESTFSYLGYAGPRMAATAASPIGRLRRALDRALPRTPQGFAALATAVVVVMWVNVASGALVRVTGSGLGCPDWPGCHGRPVPPMAGHALIEFSNRLIALTGIVLALVAFAAARRAGADRRNRRIALAIALLMLAQAPLGALTVLFDLNPLLVISHFLVAVVVVALSAVLWQRADLAAVRSSVHASGRAGSARSRSARRSPASG